MASEKMSRKSDTKNPPTSIRFQRLSSQSSFQHISWRKIHAYCTHATYRARVEKNHRDNHRQIVSEWRGRRVNDAKISNLPSPWRRRQKCLFKKIKRTPFVGYRALIGVVVFGFSHRGIDGGLIGIDDCSSCFCRGQLSICWVYFTHLVRGNNKRAFDCLESPISLGKQISSWILIRNRILTKPNCRHSCKVK